MDQSWQAVADVLGTASGSVWSWDHTGGGCYALTTRMADRWLVVTWADDPFSAGDTPADGDAYGLGMYAPDGDGGWQGDAVWYGDACPEVLPMVVRECASVEVTR